MATLRESITVETPIETAFDYTADFANIEQWDPGVSSSAARSAEPPALGSTYDLKYRFGGRETPMVYEITELERPHRVVFSGRGTMVDAVDTIEFSRKDDSTVVTYTAELTFKGLLKLLEPFMGGRLDKIGKEAVAGLERELRRLSVG